MSFLDRLLRRGDIDPATHSRMARFEATADMLTRPGEDTLTGHGRLLAIQTLVLNLKMASDNREFGVFCAGGGMILAFAFGREIGGDMGWIAIIFSALGAIALVVGLGKFWLSGLKEAEYIERLKHILGTLSGFTGDADPFDDIKSVVGVMKKEIETQINSSRRGTARLVSILCVIVMSLIFGLSVRFIHTFETASEVALNVVGPAAMICVFLSISVWTFRKAKF